MGVYELFVLGVLFDLGSLHWLPLTGRTLRTCWGHGWQALLRRYFCKELGSPVLQLWVCRSCLSSRIPWILDVFGKTRLVANIKFEPFFGQSTLRKRVVESSRFWGGFKNNQEDSRILRGPIPQER